MPAEGVREVRKGQLGMGADVLGQLPRHRREGAFAARVDRQHHERRSWVGGVGRLGARRPGQHDVRVGATEAERVDACDAPAVAGEGPAGARNVDLEFREGDTAAGSVEVQVRGDVPVAEHQRGLDQSGDAGAGLEVADVGLHRSDEQRLVRRAVRGERIGQGTHLDRVSDRCSGAVRLDVADLARLHPRPPHCGGDRRLLRVPTRHGDAVGVAVLRDGGPEDLGVHLVAVTERVGERLDDDHGCALAAGVAVRRLGEGLASSVWTEESALRLGDRGVGPDDHVHPARDRKAAFSVPDALRGKVNGDQRTRAGRVDGHAGSAEVERERDAVRQHRHHHAGRRMGLEAETAGAALVLQELVVECETADEDADVGAGQHVGANPAVLQGLPRGVQQQPLLGVDEMGLAWRHPEELCVEAIDLGEVPTATRRHLPGLGGPRIMETLGIPAAFGNVAGGVDAVAEELPVLLR